MYHLGSFIDVNSLIYINSETSLLESTGMFPATNRFKYLHYSVLGYFGLLLRSDGKFMFLMLRTIIDFNTDNIHDFQVMFLLSANKSLTLLMA